MTPATQHARVTLRLGRRGRVTAEVGMTAGGLLAIGGMVSAILLSTAILVRAARRG